MVPPIVNFVTAVRVLIDLEKVDREMRCEVLAVRLAVFGIEGNRDMKASLYGEPETSWFLLLEEDINTKLRPDPRDVDVIYFCCEGDEAPYRRFANATQGERVVDYIQETLAMSELFTKCPGAFHRDTKTGKGAAKEVSGGKDKARPPGKHMIYGLTREQYFFHKLRGQNTLEILRLLSTDMEDVDITSDHVFEKKESITNSTDVYVSWHTVVSSRYVE